MPLTRAESDAIDRLFGESQENLDRLHKDAEEVRARIEARGPPPIWYPCDSDSDLEDTNGAPMSPPQSPKDDNVLDISVKAWDRRIWTDLSQGIEPRDTGFNKFETWRSHMISEHAKRILPTFTSLQKPEVIKKPSSRPVVIASDRLTRSKTSTASTFYELGHDSKTSQPLSIISSMRPKKSCPPLFTTRSTRQRKGRSLYRVQKK